MAVEVGVRGWPVRGLLARRLALAGQAGEEQVGVPWWAITGSLIGPLASQFHQLALGGRQRQRLRSLEQPPTGFGVFAQAQQQAAVAGQVEDQAAAAGGTRAGMPGLRRNLRRSAATRGCRALDLEVEAAA